MPVTKARIREAVKAVAKETRTAKPDYAYDVYVSYRRSSAFEDWTYRVFDILRSWLTFELGGSEPEIFFDVASLRGGTNWPNQMRGQSFSSRQRYALQSSRCMVALLSPSYFQSEWCVWEWQSFLARERQLGLQGKLIFPICYYTKGLPDEARAHHCLDVSGYVSSLPSFWDTPKAVELEDKLKGFAASLAKGIKEGPPYHPDFPVYSVGEDSPRKGSKIAGRRS